MSDVYVDDVDWKETAKDLAARIGRVEALHKPRPNSISALYPIPACTCGENYPCTTIQTLKEDA